jgi:ATP-dependent helicase HrpA
VVTRQVPYERVDSAEATRIFIREALVEDGLQSPHAFVQHNRQLGDRLQTWQTRVRGSQAVDLDQAGFDFYAHRLTGVSSVHDLNRVVEQGQRQEPRFLFMQEADLLGDQQAEYDRQAFPGALQVDGQTVPLSYAYHPGQEDDGVTVKLPYKLVHAISPEVLEWLVPGLMEEKVTCLLRSLPKALRKQFVPIPEKARQIAAQLRPGRVPFLESLEAFIRTHYHLQVRRHDWDPSQVPEHLRMRVEVLGTEGQPVIAGRDLEVVAAGLEDREPPADLEAWRRAEAQWAREGIREWDFADLPERIEVAAVAGVPLWGYPGLETGDQGVRLRLFRKCEEAREATRQGALRLAQLELRQELAWLRRDLGELAEFKLLYRPLGTARELQEDGLAHLERYLFDLDEPPPQTQAVYAERVQQARARLPGLAPGFIELVHEVLARLQDARLCPHPYPGMEQDLARLVPPRFLRMVPYPRLPHLCRYLKALLLRTERAHLGSARDAQKMALVNPYQEALDRLLASPLPPPDPRAVQVEEFRWLVEEFRVSVFAQELGTACPVSTQRLDQRLAALGDRRERRRGAGGKTQTP